MSIYTTDKVPFPPYVQNDLRPELLGFSSLNPFAGYNSSPRASMFNKNIGQTLVIKYPETRYLQTGIEREMAKYTFNIAFEHDCYIIATIAKYPYTAGIHQINHSPMTTVIYEKLGDNSHEVDVLYLEDFYCNHHYAGFNYKYNLDNLSLVRPGNRIKAGTIIADSPSVTIDGDYQYGINANVLLSSHPGGTEDGAIMSESFAKRLTTCIYETREFTFGNGVIPLNCYGNNEHYKIFPDIGEHVRDDGVLFATRDFVPMLAPCDMSVKSLQTVTEFDTTQYARPGGVVVDITVTKGTTQSTDIFTSMEDQVEKYHERHMSYYKQILDTYNKLRKDRKGRVNIGREFNRLLVEAQAMTSGKVKLTKKRKKLPPWTVTITVMYEVTATTGFKVTDTHGGKSVVVQVKPDNEMPRDKMGNIADLIVDDKSTIKRLIKGKLHEHYIGACRRDLTTRLRQIAAPYNGDMPDNVYFDIWEKLLGFYKIVSPPFYQLIGEIQPDIYNHVDTVLEKGIFVYLPTDNPVTYMDVVKLLKKYYPACNDTLTMVDHTGATIETKDKAVIGEVYYIMLDKIANDYSAVSSAKLQHFGLPSKLSRTKKFSEPIKSSPVRFGESEYRLFASIAGGKEIAELADRSTNPEVHEEILNNLLTASTPTNVDCLVDRRYFPVGEGYINRVLTHEFESMGIHVGELGKHRGKKIEE